MDVAAAVEYVQSGKGRVAPVYSREISKISQRNLVYSFLISGLQTLMFSQQVLSDRVIVMSTAVLALEYVSDQHQNKYKYSSTATKFSMYNKVLLFVLVI